MIKFILFVFILIGNSIFSYGQNGQCNCWLTRDSTWSIAAFDGSGASGGPGLPPEYRNDDWSTASISLPFNFCFYGDTVISIFINNNGNISFDLAYSTFTANSYPDPTYDMIAPFWADADTRGLLSGIVYYKISSDYLVIQWDHIGYFNSWDDKLNTFQLIISDGTASVLPEQKNVGFCYKEMEWTTGDASSGAGGFGGIPATVGVNYGDGINYLQIGQYDAGSFVYDGPYGLPDGVYSLSNQSFAFNVCANNFNVPPILSGDYLCDTIVLCVGDTFNFNGSFLAPEMGQITTVTIDTHNVSGVTFSSTPGLQASISLSFIAGTTGPHMIEIFGTDDGIPSTTTNYSLLFDIQTCSVGIEEYMLLSNSIYPNPVDNILSLSFQVPVHVNISDLTGRRIMNMKILEQEKIDVSDWQPGLYFITIESPNQRRSFKFIKN
jgi:hypothetical protein